MIFTTFHGYYGTFGKIEIIVFNNRDGNPQEILRIAEVESEVWAEAQITIPKR